MLSVDCMPSPARSLIHLSSVMLWDKNALNLVRLISDFCKKGLRLEGVGFNNLYENLGRKRHEWYRHCYNRRPELLQVVVSWIQFVSGKGGSFDSFKWPERIVIRSS